MKTKRILSITLIMALVLSLFTGVMPSVLAEPTNTDFVPESYYFDFSQYNFDTMTLEEKAADSSNYKCTTINPYSATVNCGVWSLEEDSTATGGKYLKYVKDNNGSGTALSNFLFVANPTGDYTISGEHIVLADATTYNIKIRYKIENLEDEKYDLNLFAVATGNVTTPNSCPAENLVYIKKGLGNTDGWVEALYSFTTPDSYTGTANSLLLGFNPGKEGTTTRPATGTAFTYSVAIDYVEIEKPEFAAQHMNIDFNDYAVTKVSGNSGSIYNHADARWEIAGDDNKYMSYPSDGSMTSTSSAQYAFMANPTGSGSYAGDQAGLAFILENGGEYSVSFKYRLSNLASGGTLTVKVGATGATSCCNGWSGANTAIVLTPEDGTSGITLEESSDWKTVNYTFAMSTTSTTARRSMQMAFVPNYNQRISEYTLDLDDIVVDRLATVKIVDQEGNTATQKGVPAAPIGTTGMGGNKAETFVDITKAEIYNGTTAMTGEYKYYNDKDLTKEITEYTFNPVNETVYAKFVASQPDTNQVAFCGFDKYTLRTKAYEDTSPYGAFVSMGYNNSTTEHAWDIVDTEAYSGTKSMHLALSSSYNSARKFLYIGNGYEFEDNVSYQVSLRIKKDNAVEQDGNIKINLGNGGDIYGRFIYGQEDKSNIEISATNLSDEWTEITFSIIYIPQALSNLNYSVDYYRAPTLRFDTDSNVAVYIDAITISTVCGETSAEVIDTNANDNKQEIRVTSSYIVNDSDKVVLAGNEYDVVERGILAKASTNTSKLIAGEDGVLFVKKTENLDDYWADGENGEKIFAMLIEGISVNDHREITARSYVKLSDGNTYYSPETTFSVGDSNAPAGYSLVWGDEFDGTELDTTKWNKEYNVSAPLYQTDSKDVMSVENGMLNLNVTRHVGSNTNLKYDVPMGLTTSKTMNYAYGYLEVRARVPYQKGLSSAFWFRSNGQLSKDAGTKLSDTLAEIDMIETLTFTDRVTPNIHKWLSSGEEILHTQYNSGSGNTTQQYVFNSENLCDEFHIYGFEWTETEIKMYVDRVLYATYDITKDYEKTIDAIGDMAAFKDPAHIIIGMKPQLAESGAYDYYGDGSGYTTDDTVFETPYSIDWIRLYQKDDAGMLLK